MSINIIGLWVLFVALVSVSLLFYSQTIEIRKMLEKQRKLKEELDRYQT